MTPTTATVSTGPTVRIEVRVPATVGNSAAAFDVGGFAVEGLEDTFTFEFSRGLKPAIDRVDGVDAAGIPRDASNVTLVASQALLGHADWGPRVSSRRALPLAGGLGSSAAASLGGALGAAMFEMSQCPPEARRPDLTTLVADPTARRRILRAALAGERSVAGAHLDNIAPALLGGFVIVIDPHSAEIAPVGVSDLHVALVTPQVQINTREARALLPDSLPTAEWVAQMGRTAALVAGFAHNDPTLIRAGLVDLFAEPRRKALIPRFDAIQAAARRAGAIGGSISGGGPTVFALADAERVAAVLDAMTAAAGEIRLAHCGPVARVGAQVVMGVPDVP